jgi:hypothetical protein
VAYSNPTGMALRVQCQHSTRNTCAGPNDNTPATHDLLHSLGRTTQKTRLPIPLLL